MEAVKIGVVLLLTLTIFVVDLAAQAASRIEEIKVKQTTDIGGPLYELVIRNDGSVKYHGEVRAKGVKEEGRRTYRISAEDFRKIAKKIEDIDFFRLQDKYYELEIGGERMLLTDQPSTTITVAVDGKSKSVEDSLGAPKRLYELEQLIFKATNLSAWLGSWPNFDDMPYYDYFPLHKRMKYRGLLQSYGTGDHPERVAGYDLQFINNSLILELKAARPIEFSRFKDYIVDATGHIERQRTEHVFVVDDICRVRPYPKFKR